MSNFQSKDKEIKTKSGKGKKPPLDKKANPNPPKPNGDKDTALDEYKLLNTIIVSESSLFWTRFSALFAVNTFLLGIFGFLIKDLVAKNDTGTEFIGFLHGMDLEVAYIFGLTYIIIGFMSSLLWFTITEKNDAFIGFILGRMEEVEKDLSYIKKQTIYNAIFRRKTNAYSKDDFVLKQKAKLGFKRNFSMSRHI